VRLGALLGAADRGAGARGGALAAPVREAVRGEEQDRPHGRGRDRNEIVSLSTRIEEVEKQLEALAKQLPVVARLRSVPGIGLLTATALYAFVGDISRFPSGRHLASFLGLTPREYSSGLRRRLGRISKRGDAYLRMLLIHGARAILWHAKRMKQKDRLRAWALRLERKLGHNKAAVALANKLARIAWAVWKNDRNFEPAPEQQAA
jgi:transposase